MNSFSRMGFILATLGSSIGLGHIWRFPYMAGENGGGAFVIFYLILAICIGVSMLIAEMLLGNKGRSNPMDNYVVLDKLNNLPPNTLEKERNTVDSECNKSLMWLGFNSVAGPLILSFYAVVMGWVVYYLVVVSFMLPEDIEQAQSTFTQINAHSIIWQSIGFGGVILITALVVARGAKGGIEKLNFILMPLLFLIFIGLLIYAYSLPEFQQAWYFMFSFEPEKITSKTIIDSLGQVFFSLSLGAGTIVAYAASAKHNENLLKSSLWVVVSGIFVSLIAGLIIFTFIYHFQGQPSQGPGLLFISLPLAFNALGESGNIVSVLFFIAVLFAGITSTVSMLEPGVSILRDKFQLSQAKASYILSGIVFVIGFLVIIWANAELLLPKLWGKDLFGILDFATSCVLMPLGTLTTLIFIAWYLKKPLVRYYTPYLNNILFEIWWWILRVIAPGIILVVLLSQIAKSS